MPKTAKPVAKPVAKPAPARKSSAVVTTDHRPKPKPAAMKAARPTVATAELPPPVTVRGLIDAGLMKNPATLPDLPPPAATPNTPSGLPTACFQTLDAVRALPEKPGKTEVFNAQPGSVESFVDTDGRSMRVVCIDGAWGKQERAK